MIYENEEIKDANPFIHEFHDEAQEELDANQIPTIVVSILLTFYKAHF
jgi:hypothetical protein